jgi:Flp pilus assembly protein TadG
MNGHVLVAPSGARPDRCPEQGSATLELAIVAPALLLLLSLVVAAGRVVSAGSAVEQAASAAARAASLARDERSALAQAEHVAGASMRDQGITCSPAVTQVQVSGFAVQVGRPASVSVEVRCAVLLADLAVPGLPGSRVLSARATSPLDQFRTRS